METPSRSVSPAPTAPVIEQREPGLTNPFGADPDPEPAIPRDGGNAKKRAGGVLAALAALVAKFWAAVKAGLLLIPKLKLLTTSGTALVSVAAYSIFWGWRFAIGFVVLLFVHEMGHVIVLRREGVKASAPMFIPFVGALIWAKATVNNALVEARVGLAGPVLGSIGAAIVAGVGALTGSDLLLALGYIGFFINLFNLVPVSPLDGGRAMAAMPPAMWFVALATFIGLLLVLPNPIMFIFILFAAVQIWHRWRNRKSQTPESAAYHRVSPRNQLLVGLVYVGLIVALALGMDATHILSTGQHSFRSI